MPVQLIVQLSASLQSMLSHAFVAPQLNVQSNPSGQLTEPHEFGVMQFTVQLRVFRSQPPLHCGGQFDSTQ